MSKVVHRTIIERVIENGKAVSYYCLGCNTLHTIRYEYPERPVWDYNGNPELPTLNPSIKITYDGPDAGQTRESGYTAPPNICHHFVTNGLLEYCTDSTHGYSGQRIPLPDIPKEYI